MFCAREGRHPVSRWSADGGAAPLGCAPLQRVSRARRLPVLSCAVLGGVPHAAWAGPTCPNSTEAGRYRMWVGAPRAKDCWWNRTGSEVRNDFGHIPFGGNFARRCMKLRDATPPPRRSQRSRWWYGASVRFRFDYCLNPTTGARRTSRHRHVSGNVTVIESSTFRAGLQQAAGTRASRASFGSPHRFARALSRFLPGAGRVLRGVKALEQAGTNVRCPSRGRPRIVAG